jgi:type II secretory pathway component PulM
MNGYWNSLRPMEKRLVVGVGTMVVILLNLWFVVPHFSDLPKVQQRKDKAQATLETFNKEIARKQIYIDGIRKLQGAGQDVQPEDQIFHFQNGIQSEAVRSGVQIQGNLKPHSSTNQFFIEQIQSLNLQAKEQQLVDFLFGLGSGPSLIRVRGLTLHADPTHTLLQAGVTLVASYQKKPSVRGAAASQPAQPAQPKSPPTEKKSPPLEKKTTLRVHTNLPPAINPGSVPGPTDRKSPPNIKKP